jgi:hypothetical protein
MIKDRNQLENYLAEVWSKALKTDNNQIDRNAHFFSIGGYSLLAIKVLKIINDELKLNLPLDSILNHPTIIDLAGFIAPFIVTADLTLVVDQGEI